MLVVSALRRILRDFKLGWLGLAFNIACWGILVGARFYRGTKVALVSVG